MQESLGDVMSASFLLSDVSGDHADVYVRAFKTGGQDDRHQLGASLQPLLTELKNASDPFLLYLFVLCYVLHRLEHG